MRIDRRRLLGALSLLPVTASLPAMAGTLEELKEKGRLRIAVYNDFAPYSDKGTKGIDVALGKVIAERLGFKAEVVGFNAGEDMNDDLRNMVWKGHYLGTQPADVMMHVPVDEVLSKANDKVFIFGPYHRETLAMARNPDRVPERVREGSAAVALEIFTREKVGVEGTTFADAFLMGVMNGRLRESVSHFKSIPLAVNALKEGKVSAVFAPRAELESALAGETRFPIETPKYPELKISGWPVGMAVKAEQRDLAQAIDKVLEDLKRDGTLLGIFKNHGITYQPA